MRTMQAVAGVVILAFASPAAAQGEATFHADDNGRNIRLFSPVFTVDLPLNAGTGYHWEFGNAHSRHVVLISRGPGAAPHARGIVGYPTAERFTLRATGLNGEVRIGLFPPGAPDRPARLWRITFHSAYGARPTPGRLD